MIKNICSILTLVLLACSLPHLVIAQTAPDHARFSITPSEPGIAAGSGFRGEEFTFSADVSRAKCFELDLDDGPDGTAPLKKPANNGMAVFTHVYETARSHTVILRAYRERNCDDPGLRLETNPVMLALDVIVKPPPVIADSPTSRAQFLVARSAPADAARWADFVFTADVSQATSYVLDVGDSSAPQRVRLRQIGAAIDLPYSYKRAGRFTAVLQAERGNGESVELRQLVIVTRPLPPYRPSATRIEARQWPLVTVATSEPREPKESDALFWLLLLAGAVAAVGSLTPGIAATDVLEFVPTKDRGKFDITSPQGQADLLSTRVWWRNPPHFRISDNAAVTKSQSMLKTPGR